MLPFGLGFGIAIIVIVLALKFGVIWGLTAYMAYRFFIKD